MRFFLGSATTKPTTLWAVLCQARATRGCRCLSSSSSDALVGWELDTENPHIGHLTLQSPSTYNALTVEMGREFSRVVQQRILNDLATMDVRAVILSGQGGASFSSGGNLDWLRSLGDNAIHTNADRMMSFYHSFLCVRHVPVPVIAALTGPAVGAGAGLALACDLRVGVPHKTLLGFNFTKLGIHSGMGASHFLPQTVPCATKVNELLFLGQTLSGAQAMELGLLNRLAEDPEDCTRQARDMAEELCQQHPVALRLMVQTRRAQQDVGLEQALQREALAQAACYSRSDWPEGVNAVAKKRPPSFGGYHEK